MHIGLLSGGDGWHIQDLQRAASELGHRTECLDFRRVSSTLAESIPFDAIVVRTMPPGSLEQVVFRMDLLHAWEQQGTHVLNPPRALETCVDKYLTNIRLAHAACACRGRSFANEEMMPLMPLNASAAMWWSNRSSARKVAAWFASLTPSSRGERFARLNGCREALSSRIHKASGLGCASLRLEWKSAGLDAADSQGRLANERRSRRSSGGLAFDRGFGIARASGGRSRRRRLLAWISCRGRRANGMSLK